ncbi:MAG: NADH-quinone oxidoreductase subunit C [Opitutus sp.]
METAEQIRDRLLVRFPGADIAIVANPSPSAQTSLLLPAPHARDIAGWLRDERSLQLDSCSNVTGIDWPDKEVVDTVRTTVADPAGGPAKIVEQKTKRIQPGCLEVVYHLYSVALKHGPVILRLRTGNRSDAVSLPSLTPVWRSCEFQEREVYDLFGVIFDGHPDLRRILMWDGFQGHPMRRDYVEPDDYEWEPTPHGEVLEKAKKHYPTIAPPAAADVVVHNGGAPNP